jgi:hypothetical protein
MKAVFWTRHEEGVVAKNDERETDLAKALQVGASVHGDEVEIRLADSAYDTKVVDCDLVCMAGVKSRYWFRDYEAAGIPWVYFDKGYTRERADDKWLTYWRLSVNSHHPIAFLAQARKSWDRAASMEFRYAPWRQDRGRHIIVDGGSEKNFKFNKIVSEDATIADVDAHCEGLVRHIRQLTDRPVIYRPKPSSPNRTPIGGTEFAYKTRVGVHKKDVGYDLERAHVVVSYSSAICYDAHRIGVPSIVLGGGPARPISSTSLDDIENPRLATDQERKQWLANLAWCQFEMPEFRDGTAWLTLREMLDYSRS